MRTNIFSGLTAWFSASVSDEAHKLWVEYGGRERSVDEAQFLFSEDANCPDTISVFESESYIDEHVCVFHASYVSDCVKKGNSKDVILGRYVFPPSEVLKMMGQESWQTCADPDLEDVHINSGINVVTDRRTTSEYPDNHDGNQVKDKKKNTNNGDLTKYEHIDDLEYVRVDLQDDVEMSISDDEMMKLLMAED
ncbi:hypothetical protein ACF0H5_013496 [Mactra antiquata]